MCCVGTPGCCRGRRPSRGDDPIERFRGTSHPWDAGQLGRVRQHFITFIIVLTSSRKVIGAPKAVQSVTLVGGGCSAAFDPQLIAIDNVKERVLCLLSRTRDIPDEPSSKLVLRRRVFQKVCSISAHALASLPMF